MSKLFDKTEKIELLEMRIEFLEEDVESLWNSYLAKAHELKTSRDALIKELQSLTILQRNIA